MTNRLASLICTIGWACDSNAPTVTPTSPKASPETTETVAEWTEAKETPDPAQTATQKESTVILDGESKNARWADGDSFSVPGPDGGKPTRYRLMGFNTLESYGPVHRWGKWTAAELSDKARQAGVLARSRHWTCTSAEGSGGYGRSRVSCPDLERALLKAGLAHVFAIDGDARPDSLETQKAAIAAGAGMWEKGSPEGLLTSVHSLDEKDGQEKTYNRVADLMTGAARKQDTEFV